MQLWITLGLVGVMGAIAVFLVYYIGSALNSNEASEIDEVPENHFTRNM